MFKPGKRVGRISHSTLFGNSFASSLNTSSSTALFSSSRILSSNAKERFKGIPELKGYWGVGRLPYLLKKDGMRENLEAAGELALENEEYGMCYFYLLDKPTFLVTKPKHITTILREKYNCISRHRPMEMVSQFTGSALLTDEEALARKKRGEAYKQVYYDKAAITAHEPMVQRIVQASLAKFNNDTPEVDASQFFDDIGIRIILESFLPNGFSEEEIRILRDDFIAYIRKEVLDVKKLYASKIPMIGEWLTQPAAVREQLKQKLLQVLDPKRKIIESSDNFFHRIIKIRGDINAPFSSNPDIPGDPVMAILAGVGTTATALTIIVKYLSAHPEVEEKLRSELQKHLQGKPIDYASVAKIAYLDQVINEALRLLPVSPVIVRTVEESFEMDGKRFKIGDTFMLSPYITNRSKLFWGKTALEFDPERYSPENIKKLLEELGVDPEMAKEFFAAMSYPFGIGHRNCIGKPFAMLILKLWLAAAYSLFSIKILPSNDFGFTFDPGTTHFTKPNFLKFVPLSNNPEVALAESQQNQGLSFRR